MCYNPDPTHRHDVLTYGGKPGVTNVSSVVQTLFHAYDHIEFPKIEPDVTLLTLHRGMRLCCSQSFQVKLPADMLLSLPSEPNLRTYLIYLHVVHAISFELLTPLMSDLVGLSISDRAYRYTEGQPPEFSTLAC